MEEPTRQQTALPQLMKTSTSARICQESAKQTPVERLGELGLGGRTPTSGQPPAVICYMLPSLKHRFSTGLTSPW